VVHYRLRIPEDAEGPITLRARLLHRKFTHYYTQWAYAGKPVSGDRDINHESREWSFAAGDIPPNVSGAIKDRIPELPVTTLAADEVALALGDQKGERRWPKVVVADDWERWNDWGIGMLLQGDLKGAEYAFRKATEADPDKADGWLNVARALIQEGEIEQAKPFVARAKELGPDLARVYFFEAMALKADGDYEGALECLERVRRQYPRDRVALNQIGLVRFRLRDYAGAVKALQQVLTIDPEDLQAHYTLMLAYRGLGDREASERAQKLFRRFKADESSQRLTARMRRLSAEANNERQPIHEHVSAE
jgi:tetratricopeptide (TPR) repeat protein